MHCQQSEPENEKLLGSWNLNLCICITEVLFRVFRDFLNFSNILQPLCYVFLYKIHIIYEFTQFMNYKTKLIINFEKD